jgi:hypothetical protein
MRRILSVITKELKKLIPPVIYFLVAFNLLLVTQALIKEDYVVNTYDFSIAVIGALVVGKILLIVEVIPGVDLFNNKPLIYNTVWKTFIYNVAALAIRYAEAIIPLTIDHSSFAQANEAYFSTISWAHFCLVQAWLVVLFFVYCAAHELIKRVGADTVRAMFFGTRQH